MNDIVIHAENLGKQYRVGQLEPYKTIRETLVNTASASIHAIASAFHRRRTTDIRSPSNNKIWVLRNISFEVAQGEAVGIIGRNGVGKTTLLKILTRITTPTEGYAKIRGRVGALLDIREGFIHPEFTGRENIYLMGAVLGMRRVEIKRKFDEIIAFAEIDKFLDTPVKRYSSGMRVRLAFSVAAHLEPEILLIDEVLAVGDVLFQKKCLEKMANITRGGRTVLFVSHNMGAIQGLCKRCILLEAGKIRSIGKTSDIINEYLTNSLELSGVPLVEREDMKRNASQKDPLLGRWIYTDIKFQNSRGQRIESLSAGEDVSIVLDYVCKDNHSLKNVNICYDIKKMGEMFVTLNTKYSQNFEAVPAKGRIVCNIPKLPLMPGYYSMDIRSYSRHEITNYVDDVISFYVNDGPFFSSGLVPTDPEARVLVDHNWELNDRQ